MVRSPAVEDYAKAIYAIAQRDDGPATTNALAERLGVTPASASGMCKRLGELGLVDHMPYKGVELTAEGERVALEVIDKQPFDGPTFARFGDDVHVLGGALARAMRAQVSA